MTRLWSSVIVIFFLIEGSLCRLFKPELTKACGDTDVCADKELNSNLAKVAFMPTTELELNTYCPDASKVIWCIIDQCSRKNIYGLSVISNHTADVMHVVLNAGHIVSEICTPGTKLRQDYLSGMSCFKDVLNDGQTNVGCQREGSREYENYMQSFDHLIKKSPTEIEKEKRCASVAYSLPCIADETRERCGEDASNMIMDILKRVDVLKWLCSDNNIRFLQTKFLDFLTMERDSKDTYAAFFHSRRIQA
ncbi:uncharacterized protein LOC129984655 [Argiope bruennichi]|uniref:Uncharacterized protein n=1 Tax=Argiope bruennichi TaxID=94029 RepID=A0A8T0EJ32_ARGBR|nr:uncharacterized protein LOC129984655 [Argiope bruennichi]KAF8773484.1 hypothetical protein HNY73_016143 [Argiope bruennichi]